MFVSLLLVGVVQAEFTTTIGEDHSIKDVLHQLDFFKSYGNRTKMIDRENMMVKFRHEYEDGTKTYKTVKG